MTLAVLLLLVAGGAWLWGSMQRTDLGAFQPTVTLVSQLEDFPGVLDRIAEALPWVPAAALQERDADTLLISAGPSPRCLSRGAGLFIRARRTTDGVVLEGRAKTRLNTNASAALTEFERHVRQAVEQRRP